ncbi:unnamed protein product (macronuclear) [Paramecium tetraurelia]|uniref:Uncharacterized protein n=1 Tax=Paramecium tetraurelia TaxID=5888 RepID=A0E7Q7_PARTE|nr:uncharacterized protein GSPATT00024052001 [Paramecium tetraurelia]CAK91324.1 unnamed protein product [Paramecium tetraurelia]|eukprot:XP_001458721.1 hypothetical protein (macronuclear) [Paramecium tetraurelia strain d4-2]
MKFYHSQLSSKSFIAFHLLSITTGIFFILPLIFTQMQFIVCTFTMGLLGIWQCIIFSRFQKLQIYIYSFILSLSFLLPNTYTKAVIIGGCLGLITNLQNQFTQTLQFQFLQECQYFGLLLYYLLLRNIPIQSMSIFTFISSSIIRLFLYEHNSDQAISKPQPLIIKQKQQYLSILGQFVIDLVFFGTLYLLYQLENHLIVIALSLLLLASIIVNLFQNILRQLIYAILIIQIVAIIQLILIDLVVLIPVQFIIIILFVCRPINDIYLKNNLGFELYQSEHKNSLIISTISTIFAALLIF